MNILSKNTRLLFLATLLCLHFLAVPAMGEDAMQIPSEPQLKEKKGRPDGQGRAAFRSERREQPKRDGVEVRQHRQPKRDGLEARQRGQQKLDGTEARQHRQPKRDGLEARQHGQDRQKRPERQDRVHSEGRSAQGRDMSRAFKTPTRTVASSDRDALRPPVEFKRRDAHREPARRDHAAKQKDTLGQGRAFEPRQAKTTRTNHFQARQADWTDDRARRTHSDWRDDRTRRTHSDSRGHGPARGYFPQVRHDKRPVVVKHVIHKIPERHAVVVHGRERYHYHSGRFYRPWNSGFILVRPPLGLVVLNIPLGSRMVLSAGITYHVFGDVYYRRVPTGYQVVEPARGPAAGWPDRVEVLIDRLNVRYGPEAGEEVIAQVDRYTTLRVLGNAPGWLYVEVEGEDVRGWVMERYVTTGSALG